MNFSWILTLFTLAAFHLTAAPVRTIVDKMPAPNQGAAQDAYAQLLAAGPEALADVCGMIIPPGTGDDSKARFLLSGLAFHSTRPGGETERVALERAFLTAKEAAKDREVRAFFVRQLRWCGGAETARALRDDLNSPALCEAAAFTILTIGGEAARESVTAALTTASPKTAPTLLRAAGQLQCEKATETILGHAADSQDLPTRRMAIRALAEIGDPRAESVLLGQVTDGDRYQQSLVLASCLRYAQRQLELQRPDAASRIARQLLAATAGLSTEPAGQAAALHVLHDALGEKAIDELLGAVRSEHPQVVAAAADLLATAPAARLLHEAQTGAPASRAALLSAVGNQRDATTLPGLSKALNDDNESVRQAAISAISGLNSLPAAHVLLQHLATKEADTAAVAKALQTMSGDEIGAAISAELTAERPQQSAMLLDILEQLRTPQTPASLLPLAQSPDKALHKAACATLARIGTAEQLPALIDLLANSANSTARRSATDAAVQIAQRIKPDTAAFAPFAQAYTTANTEAKAQILKALPSLGSSDALALLQQATQAADATVRDAGVRALTKWPHGAAIAPLLKIAADSEVETHRILAVRGAVGLIGQQTKLSDDKRVTLYQQALDAAPRPDEKKLALAGLSGRRSRSALHAAGAFLNDPALKSEAALAVAKIVASDKKPPTWLDRPSRELIRTASELLPQGEWRSKTIALIAQQPVGANLAQGKPVTTSIQHEGANAPERAVDGKRDIKAGGWWGAGSPAWLQVDLGARKSIDQVRCYFYYGRRRYYQYTVSVSEDGKTWTQVADMSKTTTPTTAAGATHSFKPRPARYVRVDITRNSANPSVHLLELEVYAPGTGPKPEPVAESATLDAKPDSEGFVSLFNGKDLTGWVGDTKGYGVQDGAIVCLKGKGKRLSTAKQYDNFILRFEFKLTPGANNGLAIRSPLTGDPARNGYELQILDNTHPKYAKLKPFQYHGSIYSLVPAKRGHLKPVGQWNQQEVIARGDRITVTLNGTVIVDADVGKHKRPERGHIGFLGHGDEISARNIRIKELHNIPPRGFTPLFNGQDLSGWKGLVTNPIKRAKMTPEELAKAQIQADARMRKHWQVVDGVLVFDGKGDSLCTAKDYADFELHVDWKIKNKGDSGIYLRGSPQVQIWDPARWPVGSGGLYNNKKNPRNPLVCADRPVGQWNRFRIRMVGEKVTVHLNDQLVTDNVTLENYWDRKQPIFPSGQIELQNHGNTLYFRNVYLREIARPAEEK